MLQPRSLKLQRQGEYLAVTAKETDGARHQTLQLSSLPVRQFQGRPCTDLAIGLYARRPVRCVPLAATHCRLRLAWREQHCGHRTVVLCDDFRRVRFSLQSDSRRFSYRAPGTLPPRETH
ncbi:hypothetical protein AVEN_19660-1 [Araneus ventricosus]|uniref:Uncharacterized protein n=1 Tax=Araneus ventricosus TaxID=182803 RepID=A0A4Y2C2G1_ARAVE|nr:hypothetical protein AVEN_19660-1 [Araneus ventricosus]